MTYRVKWIHLIRNSKLKIRKVISTIKEYNVKSEIELVLSNVNKREY